MSGTRFKLEAQPTIPEQLSKLQTLASDLLYSWDRAARGLFRRLDVDLWSACGHNPKVFLRRVSQQSLDAAVDDRVFMEDYNQVVSSYESYFEKGMHGDITPLLDPEQDLIAYFCAEFGFHESFPIYSGGLGILAGDHCKAVSDLGIPFVAIGLLYRQGYFSQTIDARGHQQANYTSMDFDDLPIRPAKDENGVEVHVEVEFPERKVILKVWHAKAGHISLYLLDSDLLENSEADRSITFQLYGGDAQTRIQQEIILGIGGVRALNALGLRPNVWHINEGHAAFQIVERCREYLADGMDFDSSLELVAAATVFTIHTPVIAGHDIFAEELVTRFFSQYTKQLGISLSHFLKLGGTPNNHGGFNMTSLALRGSRFHNGVSRIHGGVASKMESYIWPEIPADENPISYVTNGIHAQTFLAREWVNLFDTRFHAWRNELLNESYWSCIDDIPDHRFWSLRQELKSEMLTYVCARITYQYRRNGYSEGQIKRITQNLSQPERNVLILGFARRFATYKRANLIFSDPQRLARLVSDPERPVLLIFAGKAHPNDTPGQELIRSIHEFTQRPEFLGKVVVLEGYDMAVARKLVTGVDVWLNTPEYPLEASGTSGQKAAINGVINLSVLDGWWGEGYDNENGWAIVPHGQQFDADFRDREEASDLLDILEYEVIPSFYERSSHGYSTSWVTMAKASMKSCIPRFNAQRMVRDYVKNYYSLAKKQHALLATHNGAPAIEMANWKKKIDENWKNLRIKRLDTNQTVVKQSETLPIKVSAFLNGLSPDDVAVECIISSQQLDGTFKVHQRYRLQQTEVTGDETIFSLDLKPSLPGINFYQLRIYPYHQHLSHPFETGYIIWL